MYFCVKTNSLIHHVYATGRLLFFVIHGRRNREFLFALILLDSVVPFHYHHLQNPHVGSPAEYNSLFRTWGSSPRLGEQAGLSRRFCKMVIRPGAFFCWAPVSTITGDAVWQNRVCLYCIEE